MLSCRYWGMSQLGGVINAATDHSVSTGQVLSLLQVVAYRTNSQPLKEWLEAEINGYETSSAPVPPYRKAIRISVKAAFVGPFSMSHDVVLSAEDVPSDSPLQSFFQTDFTQSVSELEALLALGPDQVLGVDAPIVAVQVYNNLAAKGKVPRMEGMQVQRLTSQITPAQVQGIVSKTRNAALKFALSLESVLPQAGDEPITEPEERERIGAKVSHIYNITINGGQNNVGVNAKAVQTVNIAQGDTSALDEELRRLGVEPYEAAALIDEFLNGATPKEKKEGAKKLLEKLGSGAVKVGGSILTPENLERAQRAIEQWAGGLG